MLGVAMEGDFIKGLTDLSNSPLVSDVDRTNISDAIAEVRRLRSLVMEALITFDFHYVCEYCDDRAATYLNICSNPLHRLHDIYMSELERRQENGHE